MNNADIASECPVILSFKFNQLYSRSRTHTPIGHGPMIRIGNSNNLPGAEVVEELKRLGRYVSLDKKPCHFVTESDLNKDRIKSIYDQRGLTIFMPQLCFISIFL